MAWGVRKAFPVATIPIGTIERTTPLIVVEKWSKHEWLTDPRYCALLWFSVILFTIRLLLQQAQLRFSNLSSCLLSIWAVVTLTFNWHVILHWIAIYGWNGHGLFVTDIDSPPPL